MSHPHTMGDNTNHGGGASATSGGPQTITAHEAVEVAGRNVEKMIHSDGQYPSLAEKLRLGKILFRLPI
jgi:hypothetical protein